MPELQPALEDVSVQNKGERLPALTCFSHAAHDAVSNPGSCKSTLMAYLKVLPCKLAFQLSSPQLVLVHRVNPLWIQNFAFPFVELHEIPVSTFLKPVNTLWMAAHPSGYIMHSSSAMSSANLLMVHSVPSSRSLMKRLNSIGPHISPQSTPLVTDP